MVPMCLPLLSVNHIFGTAILFEEPKYNLKKKYLDLVVCGFVSHGEGTRRVCINTHSNSADIFNCIVTSLSPTYTDMYFPGCVYRSVSNHGLNYYYFSRSWTSSMHQ